MVKVKVKSSKGLVPVATSLIQPYDWTVSFSDSTVIAAPVSCFKHVPLSDWEELQADGKTKVEIRNRYVAPGESYRYPFWFASIIRSCGYKILLRFEGFGSLGYMDFWINIGKADIHNIGWCDSNDKKLIPPPNCPSNEMNPANLNFTDWLQSLMISMDGALTLPSSDVLADVQVAMVSKYKVGDLLEVLDSKKMSRVKLATVKSIVGKILHLMYFDAMTNTKNGTGVWHHEDSTLIHPCGWAATVGHDIVAPPNYSPEKLPSSSFKFARPHSHIFLKEGMKLEMINPLDLTEISSGTIEKVLNHGYMMVRADCVENKTPGLDWICVHVTSPDIFPCGFSQHNNIPLTPPFGYDESTFDWSKYCAETGAVQAPIGNLDKEVVKHKLKVGMKVEARDLCEPFEICVGTITRVASNLVRVSFDGWSENYDQWMAASSPDIYPVGYCELAGLRLEGPPQPTPPKKNRKPWIPKKRQRQTKTTQHLGKSLRTGKNVKRLKSALKRMDSTPKFSMRSCRRNAIRSKSKAVEVRKSLRTKRAVTFRRPSSSPVEHNISDSDSEDSWHADFSSSTSSVNDEPESPSSQGIVGVALNHKDPTLPSTIKEQIGDKNSSSGSSKLNSPAGDCEASSAYYSRPRRSKRGVPELGISWTAEQVKLFLEVNQCGEYAEIFFQNNVKGENLLALTFDQIVVFTQMRLGPALRIKKLIADLKIALED